MIDDEPEFSMDEDVSRYEEETGFRFHPAAGIFPMMPEAKLDKLGARMKAQGQRNPIRTLDGMILDGRNRIVGCHRAGIPPWIEPLAEGFNGDPEEFVVDCNRYRQQWDEKQLAMIAAKLVDSTWGGDRRWASADQAANWRFGGKPKRRTVAEAAAFIRVPVRAVERALAILRANDPDLTLLVEAGTPWMTLGGAEALARLPEQKRRTVKDEPGYRHTLRAIRDEKAGREPKPRQRRDPPPEAVDQVLNALSEDALLAAIQRAAMPRLERLGWRLVHDRETRYARKGGGEPT